jgi:hypothetical protein
VARAGELTRHLLRADPRHAGVRDFASRVRAMRPAVSA